MTRAGQREAARAFTCPQCHAEAGRPCKTAGHRMGNGMLSPGKTIMSVHKRRLALVPKPAPPHVHKWEDTEVTCDDCGSHPGLRCADPECDEVVDLIHQDDPRDG